MEKKWLFCKKLEVKEIITLLLLNVEIPKEGESRFSRGKGCSTKGNVVPGRLERKNGRLPCPFPKQLAPLAKNTQKLIMKSYESAAHLQPYKSIRSLNQHTTLRIINKYLNVPCTLHRPHVLLLAQRYRSSCAFRL